MDNDKSSLGLIKAKGKDIKLEQINLVAGFMVKVQQVKLIDIIFTIFD